MLCGGSGSGNSNWLYVLAQVQLSRLLYPRAPVTRKAKFASSMEATKLLRILKLSGLFHPTPLTVANFTNSTVLRPFALTFLFSRQNTALNRPRKGKCLPVTPGSLPWLHKKSVLILTTVFLRISQDWLLWQLRRRSHWRSRWSVWVDSTFRSGGLLSAHILVRLHESMGCLGLGSKTNVSLVSSANGYHLQRVSATWATLAYLNWAHGQ